MNRRFISVLMFAFVVAAGASFVLYKLVVGRVNANAPQATSSILVASKNLELGSVILAADIHVVAWPGVLPKGAVVKMSDAVGRGVAAPIYANEPVTESRLGEKGAGGGLAATIPAGLRAVAIRVNEVVGLAGFVVAGTHVDVLVSGNSAQGGDQGGTFSKTLLQDISVLSAGQDFKKDNEGKPVTVQVVNLLVTPEQAEMLSLAGSQMTMQLVLRNPLDKAITATPGVTLSSLIKGRVAPAAPAVPRTYRPPPVVAPERVALVAAAPLPVQHRMEIITGNKRVEMNLEKAVVRQ